MDLPFLRPDDPSYPEILTDGAVHVIGGQGIDRFSVRALARWMRVAPSTVLNDYSRARILELVVIAFEARWLAWSASDPMFGPARSHVPLRLPATADECLGVRVHNALHQLAEAERLRGNPAPAVHLERLRDKELALLRFRLERQPPCCAGQLADQHVVGIMAMISGLRLALAERSAALTWDEACAALGDYVALVTVHSAGCEAGRVA